MKILTIVSALLCAAVPVYVIYVLIKEYPNMGEKDKRVTCFIFGAAVGALITFLSMIKK